MAKKSSSKEKVSPVRKQYLDIKTQHQDAILFFRLGDFYETFDEDAAIVARELDIVLTSRNVAKGVRVPMAGIPHHAMENYLSRLIERGYHVAICEQVGDEPIKGLMPREVVRIITPGTIVEPGLLPGDANNYLVAVVVDEKRAGLSYVDITTGEFAATELEGEAIFTAVRAEINRLTPAEILLQETLDLGNNEDGLMGYFTSWPDWRFESGRCESALLQHFGVASVDGFGLRDKSLAVERLLPIVAAIQDPVRQAHYMQKLAGLVKVGLNTLEAALNRMRPTPVRRKAPEVKRPIAPGLHSYLSNQLEEDCLTLLLQYPVHGRQSRHLHRMSRKNPPT